MHALCDEANGLSHEFQDNHCYVYFGPFLPPSIPILADFNTPFNPKPSGTPSTTSSAAPSEDSIMMVMSLGFTREQSLRALKATVSVFLKRGVPLTAYVSLCREEMWREQQTGCSAMLMSWMLWTREKSRVRPNRKTIRMVLEVSAVAYVVTQCN